MHLQVFFLETIPVVVVLVVLNRKTSLLKKSSSFVHYCCCTSIKSQQRGVHCLRSFSITILLINSNVHRLTHCPNNIDSWQQLASNCCYQYN